MSSGESLNGASRTLDPGPVRVETPDEDNCESYEVHVSDSRDVVGNASAAEDGNSSSEKHDSNASPLYEENAANAMTVAVKVKALALV